jgi:T5orf172 domain
MTPFSPEELQFLARHGFSPEDVYDGRFETKTGREMSAKEAGKILVLTNVIGRRRCRGLGHRLRTASGHCVQCNPKNIAFQARESSPGYVYIAGSLSGRLIKIGTAKDIPQRERQLRAEQHGGLADWIVLFSVKVSEAGRIERDASLRVEAKKVFRPYYKDGYKQMATEILECSFSAALRALTASVGDIDSYDTWQSSQCRKYEFI